MADSLKFYNPSTNYNKLFNNTQFIQQLLNGIRNNIKRQLTRLERQFIINFLQNVNPVIFKFEPKVILAKLEQQIVEQIVKNECHEEIVDIHEMMKEEIGVSTEDIVVAGDLDFTQTVTNNFSNQVDVASILGTKNFADLKNLLNPGAEKKTAYLLLDTRYRVLDNDGRTIIKWNFTSNTTTVQGSTNAIGDIQNITSMRVFPMKMPYNAQADNSYSRVTMYIQEFSAQSFIGHENRNFHFIFETTIGDRFIKLEVPRDSDGVFKFRNPVSRLDSLNINFASPLQPITFDNDRRNMLVSSYGTSITFVSTDAHNLETGDLVYIKYFTTANPNNPALDSNIISTVNHENGIIVTYVDATHVSIAVDTTLLVYVGPGTITATNLSNTITGVGTAFLTTFVANDIIDILGIRYTVASITSNTVLKLSVAYVDLTAGGLAYSKSNGLPGMNPSFYFGSKRMFIPMQFEYIALY